MRRVVAAMLVAVLLVAPLVQGATEPLSAFAQTSSTATTTDNLNLRTSASMSGNIILVIPRGVSVVVNGSAKSGFLPVTYKGTQGWAHQDYLSLQKPSGTPSQTGTVTEALNLRLGPSSGQRAILVMPAGATVTITGRSSNGYLAVTYGGYSGYAHGDWIRTSSTPPPATEAPVVTPPPASNAGTGRITEDLNLRSAPNTSSAVIMVLPAGATVTLTGNVSGSFRQLTYKGKTGWAHSTWIAVTSTPKPPVTPTPPPTSTPTPDPTPLPPVASVKGPASITEDLNLRSKATTSAPVLLVLPAGAKVTLTGKVSGVFYELQYNGKTGWAHKDWIRPEQTTVIPTNTARVTESVNLRGGPATNYTRIIVIPAGVTVTLTGQRSNGFHSVSYNGKSGWAFSSYLKLDSSSANLPVVPPGSVEPQPDKYPPITTNQGFHYTNALVGPVRGTPEQVIEYAKRAKSKRIEDVELYVYEVYRLAPILGFDPALIIAQSALETGYWHSKWWEERLNPAGLGINDNPSSHPYSQTFPNGTIAARAQLAHMHAEVFGNRKPLHKDLQGIDVTYELVFKAGWAGTVVTLDDLSGTWATDPQYGWKISRVAAIIFG